MAPDEITNEIILEHLQSMKLDFGKKFDSIDLRFDKMEKRMDSLEKRLTDRIDALSENLNMGCFCTKGRKVSQNFS